MKGGSEFRDCCAPRVSRVNFLISFCTWINRSQGGKRSGEEILEVGKAAVPVLKEKGSQRRVCEFHHDEGAQSGTEEGRKKQTSPQYAPTERLGLRGPCDRILVSLHFCYEGHFLPSECNVR
ncbi:hypothetical protein TNIN_436801 [Trichonephila inaurata madagascariensis]|uniref:Uncharacterized protein n=1 Tax=Trichonephila inaurata madagascariensis TaxID=2747483 RepID=A0A8X6X9B3_9ARAC|nr:hypothetical protein TNIN_436801 [Trichonephila inaurata madagascariensis]